MKWLVILLICAALGFAVYHYRDPITDALSKAKPTGSASGSASTPAGDKPEDVGPRPEPPKPEIKKPEIDPDIVEKFPLPKFKTLEELVGNWQNIPASAFPRAITVNKAVDIIIANGAGKTTLPKGSKANAIGLSGDQLAVVKHIQAPDGTLVVSPTAPKGSISIDDTDFKQVLGEIYNAWKKRKTNQVLAERKNAMREREDGSLVANTPTSNSPTPSGTITRVPEPKSVDPKVGPRPEQESNGKVAVMLASIDSGDVNEIKINEIERWGPVRYEMVDGEPYWTGTVAYKTTTLFGVIDTEAMALIRKGKVMKWVYTGSGEDVP